MRNLIKIIGFVGLFGVSLYAQDIKLTPEVYIEKYYKLSVYEMFRSKIPASITLAQALLESGCGNSQLCINSNNHFGIKCKGSWTGKMIYHDDDTLQECFRVYENPEQSFRDHSDFLLKQPRYAFLFNLEPTDYKAWAYGLKKAGYATNPQYPELLIAQIEKYNLHRFDLFTPDSSVQAVIRKEYIQLPSRETIINSTPAVIAREGETYQMIAVEYDMRLWQLQRYNDLPEDAMCKSGEVVYVKPKRNKSENEFHIVKNGETMRDISQIYAVKLRKLYSRNKMQPGEEPKTGEKIYLNSTRENKPLTYASVFPDDFDAPFNYESIYSEKKDTIVAPKPLPSNGKNGVVTISDSEYAEYMRLKKWYSESVSSAMNYSMRDTFHIVQKGQTLYAIAFLYITTPEKIVKLNSISEARIYEGQNLKIRPGIKIIYTCKGGEKISDIASQYKVNINDILKYNPGLNTATTVSKNHIITIPQYPD